MGRKSWRRNVTTILPHVAFEYFTSAGRLLPVPNPQFQRDPATGRYQVLILVSNSEEPLAVDIAEESCNFHPDDLQTVEALILVESPEGYRLVLASAPTRDEARRELDNQLVQIFIEEVGQQRAGELVLRWIEHGPGAVSSFPDTQQP